MTNKKCASRRPAWYAAEIAAALMWGPKSRPQICEAVGLDPEIGWMIQKYLDQFKASGAVYYAGFTRLRHPIYGWQPRPFELPDAVPEGPETVPGDSGNGRIGLIVVNVGGQKMTVARAVEEAGVSASTAYHYARSGLSLEPRSHPGRTR